MKSPPTPNSAFSLLEVMIAMGIFFVAIFGILELTSQSLRAARLLQKHDVDITTLAAQLSLTNRLEEGFESGDFGDMFPDVLWSRTVTEVSSNGFFRVDFTMHEPTGNRKGPLAERHLSILLYRPLSGGGIGLGNRRR
jgi:Tfp pilus assembly protein PilV